MIARSPEAATRSQHDLIVIGGGVQGIALALEAARRGLRPVLLERNDFGSATSWNSQRIVHGGLRYLQTGNLKRFRDSVRERQWFLEHFPDQVKALPCLMPLYGQGVRRPNVFRVALSVNEYLGRHWREKSEAPASLPSGRLLSAAECAELYPAVERSGLNGGALWYDAVAPDSQRLLIEMIRWATACGAQALNYVEGMSLLSDNGVVSGVIARDSESGETLEIRAPVVVNCTGPWCREMAERFDRDLPKLNLSLAFGVLLDRKPLSSAALAVTPRRRDGQTFFLLPWKGLILAGTYHANWRGREVAGGVTDTQLRHCLEQLNDAAPSLEVGTGDVLRVHWGFVPAKANASAAAAVRNLILDHAKTGGPRGLFSVSGVKFTTARFVAEQALSRILATQGARLPPPVGRARPDGARCLSRLELSSLLDADRDRAAQRVRSLASEESVLHLDDLMLRRTDWGMDPRQARAFGLEVAQLMAWDDDRIRRELERLERASGPILGCATEPPCRLH